MNAEFKCISCGTNIDHGFGTVLSPRCGPCHFLLVKEGNKREDERNRRIKAERAVDEAWEKNIG